MATATVPSFAPAAVVNLPVSTTSANVQLPSTGTPTVAVVTNMGDQIAFVQLGTANTVVASPATSMAITPRSSTVLTLGTNTWIAGVALAGVSQLNIAVGS